MANIDCDELIELLHSEARTQVELALLAQADEVAGMHLDLAQFSERQARVAEELCEEG
ncbi:MAG: hypothetical protein V4595_09100 [Pseudomonadota bacterium]